MAMPSFSYLIRRMVGRIQSVLAFERWTMYPQFNTSLGLGRIALISCLLGICLGIHLMLLVVAIIFRNQTASLFWNPLRMQLAIQWCAYIVSISIFHLAEFFATALFNPRVASSDSFVVNHSHVYTAAAMLSSLEFLVRFLFFPNFNNMYISIVGFGVVVMAQTIRTTAIVTCGESFNHLIQTSKKENHVLITRGIYQYLRHPSYFGFFYWAVGSQLLLCNPLHFVLFALGAWTFFNRRIPYEEESLRQHFPDTYPGYAARTWIGIPFVSSWRD